MTQDSKKALGKILLEQRAVRQEDLDRVLASQRPGDAPLATRLIDQGYVTELDALKALSAQRGVPGLDLSQICIRLADTEAIPREIALAHKLLPVLERDDRLFVAMAHPGEKKILEELEFVTGKRVFAYIALEGAISRAIRDAYDARQRGDTHYVGPACPADTLRKAGLDPAKYGISEQAAPPVSPAVPEAPMAARLPSAREPAARIEPATSPAARPTAPSTSAVRTEASASRERFEQPPVDADPFAAWDAAEAAAVRAASGGVESSAPTVRGSAAHGSTDPPSIAERGTAVSHAERHSEPGERAERRFRPSSSSIPAIASPVVVDAKMQKLVDEQVNEADFGDIAAELSVVAELPKAPESVRPPLGMKKVLVVDDEADIRRMMRKVLEERGFAVVEADRGRVALQLMKSESPDLVVLDAMLPEIHGFDIAKRIRGSTRYGHIPIVMVSAVYRGWRVAQDAKTAYGVDAYIEKPFKIADFIETIEAAMKARSEPAPDPEQMSADAERLLREGVAAYKLGEIAAAVELLERGVQIDPLAYRLRFHLGLLYGRQGNVYDAIEQLERAVQLQSQHFASLKNLAILYQQAGFKNRALEAWERALANTDDEETKRAIKEHIVSLL
jgi:DNA-binding response OmpR family regulator